MDDRDSIINEYITLSNKVYLEHQHKKRPSDKDLKALDKLRQILRSMGVNPDELFASHQSGNEPVDNGWGGARSSSMETSWKQPVIATENGFFDYTEENKLTSDGIHHARRKALPFAPGGTNLKLNKLGCKCICGGLESEELTRICAYCGVCLCSLHSRRFSLQGQEIILCPQHFKLALKTRDEWEEDDFRKGRKWLQKNQNTLKSTILLIPNWSSSPSCC
jgi:hypothetical protein